VTTGLVKAIKTYQIIPIIQIHRKKMETNHFPASPTKKLHYMLTSLPHEGLINFNTVFHSSHLLLIIIC